MMNALQDVYLRCIHALVNVEGVFDHGADTQYGLMNYIAKYSLASNQYEISQKARAILPVKEQYTRGTDFPRKSILSIEMAFTFEHPIPSSHIRLLISKSDKSLEMIADILDKTSYVVVLTQHENSEIPTAYKSKMPANWEVGHDPYARYRGTSIVIDGFITVKGAIKR